MVVTSVGAFSVHEGLGIGDGSSSKGLGVVVMLVGVDCCGSKQNEEKTADFTHTEMFLKKINFFINEKKSAVIL